MIAALKEQGFVLSSANSINWGRLVPQIVYYFYSYGKLLAKGDINVGDEINFSVPSGNFGDILAGYYAKKMGLPVKKLICASNVNRVLADFFETGVYDRNRDFFKTISPSMDILISSNLERFLYDVSGENPDFVNEKMTALATCGKYEIPYDLIEKRALSEDLRTKTIQKWRLTVSLTVLIIPLTHIRRSPLQYITITSPKRATKRPPSSLRRQARINSPRTYTTQSLTRTATTRFRQFKNFIAYRA